MSNDDPWHMAKPDFLYLTRVVATSFGRMWKARSSPFLAMVGLEELHHQTSLDACGFIGSTD